MTDIQTIEAYEERLTDLKEPLTIVQINQRLRELKESQLGTQAKKVIWSMLVDYAKRRYWYFDAKELRFTLEETVGF